MPGARNISVPVSLESPQCRWEPSIECYADGSPAQKSNYCVADDRAGLSIAKDENAHHRKQTTQVEYLGDTTIYQPLCACHRYCHQMDLRRKNLRCPCLRMMIGQGVHLDAPEELHNASDPQAPVFCFDEI